MSASSRSESPATSLTSTTASRVADDLRRRILVGELRPGQRLKIDELAALCAVSHMPVREALRELEGDGVLEVFPHRGAVVRAVDRRFVSNLYDVRGAIEGMLAERCAALIDDDRLAALERAAEAFEAAGPDAEARVAANSRFHAVLNQAADNPEAQRMLNQGRLLADALRVRFGYGRDRVDAIVAEHRALVRAIARRNVAKAGEIARRHCLRARDDLLERLPEQPG